MSTLVNYLPFYWLYSVYIIIYSILTILVHSSYNINTFNGFEVELNRWDIVTGVIVNIFIIINVFLGLLWGHIIFKAFISV